MRIHLVPAIVCLLALSACPSNEEDSPGPGKSEGPAEGGAEDGKPPPIAETGTETGPASGTETGSAAAPVCEDQLRECNALLEACVAKMPD